MKINVITIFPEFFDSLLGVSIVGRAIEDGALEVELIPLREYGLGKHKQLDDTPFGGGPGMVMMVEPLSNALEPLADTHRVLLTPAGTPLDQGILDRFAGIDELTLVCGRYEGVDQRVADHHVDCCLLRWAIRTRRSPSRVEMGCWRSRSTPGRLSSMVMRSPTSSFLATMGESRPGDSSRDWSGPGAVDPICCQMARNLRPDRILLAGSTRPPGDS